MIDIQFLWENPEAVEENIRKKFQEQKLLLVDGVIALDEESRKMQAEVDQLHSDRNKISKSIGAPMRQGKRDEAKKAKEEVAKINERLTALKSRRVKITARVREIMLIIPQIMDPSAPIDKDDPCNVEIQCHGEPVVPDLEIPYRTDITERPHGIDLEATGRVAGNDSYYLLGDIARLHLAILSYAHDFMIDCGFACMIPPYIIRSDVMIGVMSSPEADAMMYKIEGKDLYLIGTNEHSITGHFIDSASDGAKLPYTLASYPPCFRREKGAHGTEERGVYRTYQFEKQEMIVIRKPGELVDWCNELWQNAMDFFHSLGVPVRTFECCLGDLADLRVESCDMEAQDLCQEKYFEVDNYLNLGDAQARCLHIRAKSADDKRYLAHTLNNTYVAPPRMLIAPPENNLQADGSVRIPETFRPRTDGKSELRI